MPKYDYRCNNCCHQEEVTHSIAVDLNGERCWNNVGEYDSANEDHCPGHMQRVFHPTPAVFRGDGWAKMPVYKPKG